MMAYRWAVETKHADPAWKDRFVYGHAAPVDVIPGLSDNAIYRQIRVVLPRSPDPRTERYSGDPAQPFRPATAQEITAWDADQAIRRASTLIDDTSRALVWALLQVIQPSATKAEYQSLYDEMVKTLTARPWV